MIPKNFWLQPANGFNEKMIGLSSKTLEEKENELGVTFPCLYKQLMQLQNGGGIRRCAFMEDGEEIGNFLSIDFNASRVNTFLDYLRLTKTEAELKEMYDNFEYCYPERLIIFGDFHGHGGIFFDYGWLQAKRQDEPSVVIITDEGDEFLHYQQTKRFDSFKAFIGALEEIQGEPITILISSELEFESFISIVQQKWNSRFEIIDKNKGWTKYFSNCYDGELPLLLDDKTIDQYVKDNNANEKEMKEWIEQEGRERKIKSTFSPNQFLSGTYQFQDNTDYNIVVEINRPWFPIQYAMEHFFKEVDDDADLKISNKTIANNM